MLNGYNEFEEFGKMFAQYDKYVREMESQGKKPVSMLKFAFGKF